jgi:hypothetical protein
MRAELTAAFIEYLSRNLGAHNRRDYYGLQIDRAAADGSQFELTLTFKSGERYCCSEPGCHTGLHDSEPWPYLREVFAQRGLAGIPTMTVTKLVGIVEPGTVFGWGVPSMRPIESTGFIYEDGPYRELDG